MSKVVHAYRELYRKVGRLPLDNRSLNILRQNVRHEFCCGKDVHKHAGLNPKLFLSFLSLLDDILIYRKYKRMADLLDLIYKPNRKIPDWVTQFCSYKYSTWKDTWPQVHLLNEFGNEKSKALYREQLRELEPRMDFLLMKELNITLPEGESVLTPLPRSSSQSDGKAEVLARAQRLHGFVLENVDVLLDLKILPFEVHYEPTRLGLPLSVAARETKLKEKVNYAKGLVRSFRPVEEEDLKHLIRVASGTEIDADTSINAEFHRFMIRHSKSELDNVSPFEKKYVWQKRLIPDERNIRFYYKQYVLKQFYIDGAGDYRTSPAKNFYD